MAGECESFSISLSGDNQINCTFTGLPDYDIQAVIFVMPTQSDNQINCTFTDLPDYDIQAVIFVMPTQGCHKSATTLL